MNINKNSFIEKDFGNFYCDAAKPEECSKILRIPFSKSYIRRMNVKLKVNYSALVLFRYSEFSRDSRLYH